MKVGDRIQEGNRKGKIVAFHSKGTVDVKFDDMDYVIRRQLGNVKRINPRRRNNGGEMEKISAIKEKIAKLHRKKAKDDDPEWHEHVDHQIAKETARLRWLERAEISKQQHKEAPKRAKAYADRFVHLLKQQPKAPKNIKVWHRSGMAPRIYFPANFGYATVGQDGSINTFSRGTQTLSVAAFYPNWSKAWYAALAAHRADRSDPLSNPSQFSQCLGGNKPILILGCGRPKQKGKNVMVRDLYLRGSWQIYRKAVPQIPHPNLDVYVMSAKYGLLPETAMVCDYDMVLVEKKSNLASNEVYYKDVVPTLKAQLKKYKWGNRPVITILGKPYQAALKDAGVNFISADIHPDFPNRHIKGGVGKHNKALVWFLSQYKTNPRRRNGIIESGIYVYKGKRTKLHLAYEDGKYVVRNEFPYGMYFFASNKVKVGTKKGTEALDKAYQIFDDVLSGYMEAPSTDAKIIPVKVKGKTRYMVVLGKGTGIFKEVESIIKDDLFGFKEEIPSNRDWVLEMATSDKTYPSQKEAEKALSLYMKGMKDNPRRRNSKYPTPHGRSNLDLNKYEIDIKGDTAIIKWSSGQPLKIPKESVKPFIEDLTLDYSDIPLSGIPHIDEIIKGKAKFLGKGFDGVVFQSLGDVVKLSTTVPFHPDQQPHRTPKQAQNHTKKEFELHKRLHDIPCILPVEYVEHGGRSWIIKPYLDIDGLDQYDRKNFNMTQKEYDMLTQCIEEMHKRDAAIGDTIQVGRGKNGQIYMMDLGQSRARKQDIEDDLRSLKDLASIGNFEIKGLSQLMREWEGEISRLEWLLPFLMEEKEEGEDIEDELEVIQKDYQKWQQLHSQILKFDVDRSVARRGRKIRLMWLNLTKDQKA